VVFLAALIEASLMIAMLMAAIGWSAGLIPLREVESVIVPNTGKILRLVFSATEIWPSLYSVRDISVQEEIVLGVMRVVARAWLMGTFLRGQSPVVIVTIYCSPRMNIN
jgi:hypothetical protein